MIRHNGLNLQDPFERKPVQVKHVNKFVEQEDLGLGRGKSYEAPADFSVVILHDPPQSRGLRLHVPLPWRHASSLSPSCSPSCPAGL